MDEQRLPQHPPPERQREDRACLPCGGRGEVVENASYDEATGKLRQEVADCTLCEGRGRVSTYLYPVG